MKIARWRFALVAALLVALGAVGGGLVQASRTPSSTGSAVKAAGPGAPAAPRAAAANPAAPAISETGPSMAFAGVGRPQLEALTEFAVRPGIARRVWRHLDRLVHAEATVDLPRKGLTTYVADGGSLDSIGRGTVGVREKTGDTVSIETNAETKVRKAGVRANLAALKVGDRVVVLSEKRGERVVALYVLVRPADG